MQAFRKKIVETPWIFIRQKNTAKIINVSLLVFEKNDIIYVFDGKMKEIAVCDKLLKKLITDS